MILQNHWSEILPTYRSSAAARFSAVNGFSGKALGSQTAESIGALRSCCGALVVNLWT